MFVGKKRKNPFRFFELAVLGSGAHGTEILDCLQKVAKRLFQGSDMYSVPEVEMGMSRHRYGNCRCSGASEGSG